MQCNYRDAIHWVTQGRTQDLDKGCVSIYTHRYIYDGFWQRDGEASMSRERAAGLGKLVGRKLGGQYKTRLRCINSTIQYIGYIYWQSQQ